MKPILTTPDTLILESRPVLLGLGLILFMLVFVAVGMTILTAGEVIGAVMLLGGALLIGGLAFWGLVRRSQLWIDAAAGLVAIRQRSVTGYTQTVVPLADLKEAIVQHSPGTKGKPTQRPALRFGGKTNRVIPLTSYYISGTGPGRAARCINDWLAAGRTDPPPGKDSLTLPLRQD